MESTYLAKARRMVAESFGFNVGSCKRQRAKPSNGDGALEEHFHAARPPIYGKVPRLSS